MGGMIYRSGSATPVFSHRFMIQRIERKAVRFSGIETSLLLPRFTSTNRDILGEEDIAAPNIAKFAKAHSGVGHTAPRHIPSTYQHCHRRKANGFCCHLSCCVHASETRSLTSWGSN